MCVLLLWEPSAFGLLAEISTDDRQKAKDREFSALEYNRHSLIQLCCTRKDK